MEKIKQMVYTSWDKIKAFFKRSETIFFARLQALAGAVGGYIMWLSQDSNMQNAIQSLFQPKYVPFWVLGLGVTTELLRRRNANL